jgi:signal transduction histidine kinase
LFKKALQKEDKKNELLLSELSWEMWCLTLGFYLLFLYLHQSPETKFLDVLASMSITWILFAIVILAYWAEYKWKEFEYYKNNKWIKKRLLTNAIGIVLILLVFLLTPKG